MNFDEPDSNIACSRRRTSNTPLQALNLMNDPVFFEAAAAMGEQVAAKTAPLADRLDSLFLQCLGRKPVESERASMANYLDRQTAIFSKEGRNAEESQKGAWAGLGRVLLNLDEFITRE